MPRQSSQIDETFDGDDLLIRAKVNYRKELNGINAELEKLVKKRQAVLDKLKGLDRLLPATAATPAPSSGDMIELEIEAGSTSKAIRQVARELYLKLGRPIRRDEILNTLTGHGMVVGGKHPLQTVTRALTRARKEFRHIDDGYVLTDGNS